MSKRSGRWNILIIGGIVVLFVGVGTLVVSLLLSEDDGARKRQVRQVTMLKPPPPPKIKEKPPEVKKKKEVVEEIKKPDEPQPEEAQSDEPPPGEQLGLDAEGSGSGDAVGLAARKGGRALVGSSGGAQYRWYTQSVAGARKIQPRSQSCRAAGRPVT